MFLTEGDELMGVALTVEARDTPVEKHILNFVSYIILSLDVATGFHGIDLDSK